MSESAEPTPRSITDQILKQPKRNQFDAEIALQVNKHLALELYFQVNSKFIIQEHMGYPGQQFTDTRPSPNDLIKDMQKTLSALGEDELTREDFEQTFVFFKASQILKPEVKLPKKSKTEEVKRESDA